jgi:hypothetical protein
MDIFISASIGVNKDRGGFLGEVPSVLLYITLRLKDLKREPEVIFIVNV